MVHNMIVKATNSSLRNGLPTYKVQPKILTVQQVFLNDKSRLLKNTLDKAVKSGEDPHMSMLCLRSTPIDSQLPYPAELLYKRKL